MKKIFAVAVVAISVMSTIGVVKVFMPIDEAMTTHNTPSETQEVILGHRITSSGHFVLVTK